MSLSYLDYGMTNEGLGLTQRVGRAWKRAAVLGSDVAALYREVTSSPQFRPVAIRVTSALVVSFCLVQLAKLALA